MYGAARVDWKGRDGTNYRGPAVWKGGLGPDFLPKDLSFSVVSLFIYELAPSHQTSVTLQQTVSFFFPV